MKVKKILSVIICLAILLSISCLTAFADDAVVMLAGTETYFSNISDAFTVENNPENKQVILLKDCEQDVVINQGAISFYINGYTLTGCVRINGGLVTIYGNLAGTTPIDKMGKIKNTGIDGNYALSCGNAQVNLQNLTIEATENDGVALCVDGSKTNIHSDRFIVNGDVKATGSGIIDINAGVYNGTLINDSTYASLVVTGGTFSEDPSEFLPAGYSAVLNQDVYTITKETVSLDDFTKDTSGNYQISTKQDVINFRKLLSVTDGKDILSGTSFVMTNDIDMNNEVQPGSAGDSKRFQGSFDGRNYKISNLKIRTDSGYAAMFGNIQSGCTIQNLTLENVDIENTSNDYTGALVGFARGGTEIKNCKVTGLVKISGQRSTGGIIGGGITSMSNCALEAAEGSEIKGTVQVGGIAGLISSKSNGITDTKISGVNITANGYVGGIAGVVLSANGSTVNTRISNNSLDNVTITSVTSETNAEHCGLVVGATLIYKNTDAITYAENDMNSVSATENGETVEVTYSLNYGGEKQSSDALVMPVAKVGAVEYTDIQDAIVAAAPAGTVDIISDITVDEWVMFAEKLTISNGNLITLNINGLTINGNGHSLTVKSIESAGNGGYLFFDAENLNVNNLTIKVADGVNGGIGLTSGTIDNVTFDGGVYGVFPGKGDVIINECDFSTKGTAIYYEDARDNLVISNNTFTLGDNINVVLLRGNTTFTGNTINSGRTVNVVSGSPVVSDNTFAETVRFKVYNAATATVTNNIIPYVEFESNASPVNSTFADNVLSDSAKQVFESHSVVNSNTTSNIWSSEYAVSGNTIRFIFDANIDGEVISGIKFVKVTGTEAEYEAAAGLGGETTNSKTFYGDVTDVPEDATFYAVAFVKSGDKTYWSAPVMGKLAQ